jgi:hypothetical protein
MSDDERGRFRVVVEEAPPRGDLYELEQTTCYQVVDTRSGEVVMTFRSELQASLSRDTGLWEGCTCGGASRVAIAPDGESVIVTDCDGREQIVVLAAES